MVNIRYDMLSKNLPPEHAQKVMENIGIKYEDCEPFPIADCWIFYGCSVPDGVELPEYLFVTNNTKD